MQATATRRLPFAVRVCGYESLKVGGCYRHVQAGNHDSIEDSRAALALYRKYEQVSPEVLSVHEVPQRQPFPVLSLSLSLSLCVCVCVCVCEWVV